MDFNLNGLVHFSFIWIIIYHFLFIVMEDISKFASLTTKKLNILWVQKTIAPNIINDGRRNSYETV